MKIFHMDQEQHQKLANLLSAFAIFREDIGYVQGLSGIAVLLLQ
jgi:Rab-GTPase-TBC domain